MHACTWCMGTHNYTCMHADIHTHTNTDTPKPYLHSGTFTYNSRQILAFRYKHMHPCIHMYVQMHTRACIHRHSYTDRNTWACTHTWMHGCMCKYTHACMAMHVYISTQVCADAHTGTCIDTWVHAWIYACTDTRMCNLAGMLSCAHGCMKMHEEQMHPPLKHECT